ncbi:ABC transporter permease [Dactylosporangium sp. NPDC005572]|uniref:ABC transporter permease n=1 Tax=Dactylosporangium sp. NPDC005572 TaxID=3156889 RepID=UPI0033B54DFB
MTTLPLAARPAPRLDLGGAHLVMLRKLMIHKHAWTIIAFGVFEPALYLLSIGVGVGALVGHIEGIDPSIGYAQYVAPALLAMAAMNGAANATGQGVFFNLRYANTYQVMVGTPITARGIAIGETAWATLRGTVEAGGFLALMAAFGLVRSPLGLLALPGALLIGFAFAGMGLLAATYMRDFSDGQIMQLVMLPMFLFATTFYPITVYPEPIRYLVGALPLYHGIELIRQPVLGQAGWQLTLSAAYLAALGGICLWAASTRLRRRLDP